MIKKCLVCKKEFPVRGKFRKETAKYCSRRCKADDAKMKSGAVRKCKGCGIEFYVKGNPSSRGRYCGKKCFSSTRKNGAIIKCLMCKKTAYKPKCHLKERNFCGTKCANKYQGKTKVITTCLTCSKKVLRSPSLAGKFCSIKCRNACREWVEQTSLKANLANIKKKGLNRLEKRGSEILDEIGVSHAVQVPMFKKFTVDVLLKNYPIIIQWDGIYWHSKPRRKNLDRSQDAYIKKCGLTVLRFTDKEVKEKPSYVQEHIQRTIREVASTP